MSKINEVLHLKVIVESNAKAIGNTLELLKKHITETGIDLSSDDKARIKELLLDSVEMREKMLRYEKQIQDIIALISPRIAKDIEIETLSNAIPGITGSDQNAISNKNKNNSEENKTPEDILFNFALNEEKDTE